MEPMLTPDHYPWMSYAACTAEDPEMFFPRQVEGIKEAKAVCHTCPVLDRCRDHVLALTAQQPVEGIWAAMTASERLREIGAQGIAVCGTREGHAQHRRLGEPACIRCRAWWANAERKRQRGAA